MLKKICTKKFSNQGLVSVFQIKYVMNFDLLKGRNYIKPKTLLKFCGFRKYFFSDKKTENRKISRDINFLNIFDSFK